VWGSGPDNVWVVGYGSSGFACNIQHWNGSAWSAVAGPSIPDETNGRSARLEGVWGSGLNDVWAVGMDDFARGIVLHWDGTTWSFTKVPIQGDKALDAVWGSGPDSVWAVGNGILHH
jgi:hypothetical protein